MGQHVAAMKEILKDAEDRADDAKRRHRNRVNGVEDARKYVAQAEREAAEALDAMVGADARVRAARAALGILKDVL